MRAAWSPDRRPLVGRRISLVLVVHLLNLRWNACSAKSTGDYELLACYLYEVAEDGNP